MTEVVDRVGLVVAAQTGDPTALHRLLAVCQPDVRRYARRHCAPADIDDAVQEALIIVTRRVGSLRAAAAFTGWLLAIIERECRRLARGTLRVGEADDDAALVLARPGHELRIDLVAALESLPAHYREVVLLRDFEELTINEIAARLGEPAGAVKSRLHRARALVREYLSSAV